MVVKIIGEKFESNKWNEKAPHPLQSWEWGEAREKQGIEILRLGEFSGDNLKNVFTITFHKIPHTSFKIGYLPRSVFPSNEVLNLLEEEGKKRNCIFIKVEPYILKSKFQSSNVKSNPNSKIQILESSHPLFPNWTLMLDLTKSEEELMKKMKPKTRYNIRVAEKHGVEVREMTNMEGFEIFTKLYFETTVRQKYRGHDYHYHKIIFETLKNKIAHILIAYYKGTPLSAYELFTFNDVLYYPYGGSSSENKKVMAANLLMWETIKFGKSNKAQKFDMWGSLAPNYGIDDDWSGFTRFKHGFGGEFVEFVGSYDLVINSSLYPIYNLLNKVRSRLI